MSVHGLGFPINRCASLDISSINCSSAFGLHDLMTVVPCGGFAMTRKNETVARSSKMPLSCYLDDWYYTAGGGY